MKIIVGLGNPGREYAGTRHNIGFEIIDGLKEASGFPDFESHKKFNAEISKGIIDNAEVLLVKPQTFMNLSGTAVRSLLDFYKSSADDIIVVQDDLDIALGKYKVSADSSSAGHNGVQSIIDQLGTQKFKRLRVGIGEERDGAPVCRLGAHDFVLGKFSEEEKIKIGDITGNILAEIKNLL
ncbi:MAG: aminoacyl-tRNA hydrolase [Candidatus Moranbacteria bacterium]|nr:aminoacyl-tRNA hydrolase [Candidatus Moranbacteria bacterium]